jgi:DNA-binding response OmpR family regulator
MSRVLIVEDEPAIAELESDYLRMSGIDVEIAKDGPTGLDRGLHGGFDLVLLDIMLPGIDGFEVCRRLREKIDVPILMVTARLEDIDKIRGLGLGADDYIEKPFSPSVLVARVKSHLARYRRLTGDEKKMSVITMGDLEMNTATRQVRVSGKEVELKNREFELLEFFMLHPDVVFSRDHLYEQVWGMDALGDSATVAVHINRLRAKIEQDPSNPKHLLTVWGAGYRFLP